MKLQDRVREIFNCEIVQVDLKQHQIQVYYMRGGDGVAWVPFGGGPLYHQSAINQAAWTTYHIEQYRELLPKDIRDWQIVFGELSTRTFPGQFYPQPLPHKSECA